MARATGRRMAEPLSGPRAVRWEALPALLPFAPGFGVEVAMTMDALHAGLRVVEVEVDLHHNPTGRNLSGILHRARQARANTPELTRRRSWRPGENPADDRSPKEPLAGGGRPEEPPAGGGSPGREGSPGTREGDGGFPQPPGGSG
jgi:hypothetical protein